MYPILLCSVVAMAITLRRGASLFAARPSAAGLLDRVERALLAGDVSGAMFECAYTPGAASRVVHAGLRESLQSSQRMEGALAQQLLLETQPLGHGLGGLRMVQQIATLFGLYGTITGLAQPFGYQDSTSRACALARGISESMNCTAFGLFVSTCALTAAWVCNTRARELHDELAWIAAATRNLLVDRRHVLSWHGARPRLAPSSYRSVA